MTKTLSAIAVLVIAVLSACSSNETDESRCAPVVDKYAELVTKGGHDVTGEQRQLYLEQCVEMELSDAQRNCVLGAQSVGELSQCGLPRPSGTKVVGPSFRGTR